LTEAAPNVLEGSNGSGALQLLVGSGGGGLNWARWSFTLFLFASLIYCLLRAASLSLSGHRLLRLELGKLAIVFACCLSHCCCSFFAADYLLSLSLCMNIACCRLLLIDHESK
jgi:hypothetical protein